MTQGQAASVMCSYSTINGQYACQNSDLLGILDNQWHYPGFVTSDWGAVHSTVPSALAGLDMAMPGGTLFGPDYYGPPLKAAVQDGQVPVSALNDMVSRILLEMFRFGLFDHPPTGALTDTVTTPAHAQTGQDVAEAGTVLLKDDGGVLPLTARSGHERRGDRQRRRAVRADVRRRERRRHPAVHRDPGPGHHPARRRLRRQRQLRPGRHPGARCPGHRARVRLPGRADRDVLQQHHAHRHGRGDRDRPRCGAVARRQVAGARRQRLRVVGSAHRHPQAARRRELRAVAVVHRHRLGHDQTARACSPVQTGFGGVSRATVTLPAGTATIEVDYADTIPFGSDGVTLGWQPPANLLAQAVAAASKASVAVVFASNYETEGADLTTIDLPANENQLISAVAAANPDTVVVLNTGSAVTMPWLDQVKGVVEAWYPGQNDGNAIAAVLFGDVNPSGKLPVTFPQSLAQVPASTAAQWPGAGGQVQYSEGVLVGYRWYTTKGITPLFPFGYGLSYTSFAFSHLVGVARRRRVPGQRRRHQHRARTGAEVAQLYVGDPSSTGEPAEQLKGFQRVTLRPGQTTRVTFTVSGDDFAWWNGHWEVTPGATP